MIHLPYKFYHVFNCKLIYISIVKVFIPVLLFVFLSCNRSRSIGEIERIDPSLDEVIVAGSKPEIIAEGYRWTEGPLWIDEKKMLLFSDVFANKVFKWTEEKGTEIYLNPSGYTSTVARGGEFGSNGLLLDNNRRLLICQHGNRQIARMEADFSSPKPVFTALASHYDLKKLNSPNDAALRSNGDIFFTDPPYGLEDGLNDRLKEIDFQGVYRVSASGSISLLCDSISRPNGIAFFPGEKRLLVANSDPAKPVWYSFDVINNSLANGKIFYKADTSQGKGLPDGLKIDKGGNVFASGPGGIFIFNAGGKLLGKIKLPVAPSNCAFSADEKMLYITATNYVLRIRLKK